MYNQHEVMDFVKEEDVKFIKLSFCDINGKQKNISITNNELSHAFKTGMAIDVSDIKGFASVTKSKLILHPDPSTLSILPWRPEHGRVIRMFCDISYPNGNAFECDSRLILKNAIKDAETKGFTFSFGAKIEFYLFKLDENGNKSNIPYDKAGYMDIAPEDKGENIRRDICLTLEQMSVYPESSHHEKGAGQNKINFKSRNPLTTADNITTIRQVVSTVANRNGLCADYSPMPIENAPANNFHFNFAIESKDDKELLHKAIAGVLHRIDNCTAVINYDLESIHAEFYIPDSLANPYTTFALIIYAAMSGIDNNEKLPEAIDANKYKSYVIEKTFAEKYLPTQIISAYSMGA